MMFQGSVRNQLIQGCEKQVNMIKVFAEKSSGKIFAFCTYGSDFKNLDGQYSLTINLRTGNRRYELSMTVAMIIPAKQEQSPTREFKQTIGIERKSFYITV